MSDLLEDSPYQVVFIDDGKIYKYQIDKCDKQKSEKTAINEAYEKFIIENNIQKSDSFEILGFIKNYFNKNICTSSFIFHKYDTDYGIHTFFEKYLLEYNIIKNVMIIRDSKFTLDIPDNIHTLYIIEDYSNIINYSLLDNLPNNIENIFYLGKSYIITNANNLPITLKNLYIRKSIDVSKIKIPFGCNVNIIEDL